MTEQSIFPDWAVEGAEVIEVRTVRGKAVRWRRTDIKRVTKTTVRIDAAPDGVFRKGDVFRRESGDILVRFEGGTWEDRRTTVCPASHPEAAKARHEVALTKAEHAVGKATRAFQASPSAQAARTLAEAANAYAVLADETVEP